MYIQCEIMTPAHNACECLTHTHNTRMHTHWVCIPGGKRCRRPKPRARPCRGSRMKRGASPGGVAAVCVCMWIRVAKVAIKPLTYPHTRGRHTLSTYLPSSGGVKRLRTHQHVRGGMPGLRSVEEEAVPLHHLCDMRYISVNVCGGGMDGRVCGIHRDSFTCTQRRSCAPSSSTRFSRSRSFFFLPRACFFGGGGGLIGFDSRGGVGECACTCAVSPVACTHMHAHTHTLSHTHVKALATLAFIRFTFPLSALVTSSASARRHLHACISITRVCTSLRICVMHSDHARVYDFLYMYMMYMRVCACMSTSNACVCQVVNTGIRPDPAHLSSVLLPHSPPPLPVSCCHSRRSSRRQYVSGSRPVLSYPEGPRPATVQVTTCIVMVMDTSFYARSIHAINPTSQSSSHTHHCRRSPRDFPPTAAAAAGPEAGKTTTAQAQTLLPLLRPRS